MLHVEHYGEGPELVLLHGWAMHGAVFSDWTRLLADHFRVTVVDLPGHGHSREAEPGELAQWAEAVLDVAPARAAWTGWSLGGLVALAAAGAAPERVRALVLLASTPRFVTGAGWQTAVGAQVFDQFARQLDADIERTLSRFVALQVRGAEDSGLVLRRLRAQLGSRRQTSPQALQAGLDLLRQSDQRAVLQRLVMPVYGIFGERDTLVPALVADTFPAGDSLVIHGAGHAPFLSHARQCVDQLQQWLLTPSEQRHAVN